MLGVVPADPGALLRLGDPLCDGFPHLARHEEREGVLPLFEEGSHPVHRCRPLGKVEPPPRLEGAVRLLDDPGRLGRGHLLVSGYDFTCCWICTGDHVVLWRYALNAADRNLRKRPEASI